MDNFISPLVGMFQNILVFFAQVFDGLGAWDYVFGGFIIFTIYRFILRPIVGGGLKGGSSDKARKNTPQNKEKDN